MQFPEPYAIQNPDGGFPAVCMVEHARNAIPSALRGLGVDETHLRDHIAWDIGIEAVTRALSDLLDAPAIYCLYSRLIIDVNRPLSHPELMRGESDGVEIPGNRNLSDAEKAERTAGIYHAYHNAGYDLVASVRRRHEPMIIGMHSCAARLRRGMPRPWHIGLSTYDSDALMERMAALLRQDQIVVGIHEPYDTRDYFETSLDLHGRSKGLPNILVEIRQDLIADDAGALEWAGIMERTLRALPSA